LAAGLLPWPGQCGRANSGAGAPRTDAARPQGRSLARLDASRLWRLSGPGGWRKRHAGRWRRSPARILRHRLVSAHRRRRCALLDDELRVHALFVVVEGRAGRLLNKPAGKLVRTRLEVDRKGFGLARLDVLGFLQAGVGGDLEPFLVRELELVVQLAVV